MTYRNLFVALYLTIGVFLFSCSVSKSNIEEIAKSDPLYIKFCDYPQNLNKKVRIVANYTGLMEYAGLSSSECKISDVEFAYDSIYNNLKEEHKGSLKKFGINSTRYWLTIDMIGTFKMDCKTGYGHLGSNKALFKADEILNIILHDKL